MVEQMTGLPIGHHGLVCDHAPAGGMFSWDIRDAALDFYDRNCRTCKLRQPVNIPNLQTWVTERDTAETQRRAIEEAAAIEASASLAERQAERRSLRSGLSPVAADVVDQIDELDVRRTSNLVDRLVKTARIAPDAFPPSVVEHIFALLESHQRWFDQAGLRVLATLNADPPRLSRCAMICLQHSSATRTAAAVFATRVTTADETLIPTVLPALVSLASPERHAFEGRCLPRPASLIRLRRQFPEQVSDALNTFLSGWRQQKVSIVARAVRVLASHDFALANRLGRDLIAIFVRATWLPSPEDYGHDENQRAALDLREAIVEIFLRDPSSVDTLLKSFALGASPAGEARIFSIYCRVLRSGRFRRTRPICEADEIAFRRIIWEAPKTRNNGILREIAGIIHDSPSDLIDLARNNIDSLLGAAVLMDTRLSAFDAEPKSASATTLEVIERENNRRVLDGLRSNFVSWAADGAAASGDTRQYIEVLAGLPETAEDLAASMIEHGVRLMETTAGLNAVLPLLYSALVGSSVARRGSAATAVGEMSRKQRANAPDLLLEAFVTTLDDPYIYVHRSALRALQRFEVPESLIPIVRQAVWKVLLAHKKNSDRDDIVVNCIELLAARYLTPQELANRPGIFLITLLGKMPAWRITGEVSRLARRFANTRGFVDLLVKLLLDQSTTEDGEDRILDAMSKLPADVVLSHREMLAGISLNADRRKRTRILRIVEILGASGAWAEADQLASALLSVIPDTVRERLPRLTYDLARLAICFEHALARGDRDTAAMLASQWHDANETRAASHRDAR